MPLADKDKRYNSACNDKSLHNKQSFGLGDKHIHGQQQIEYRREMHSEMAQQTVTLTGDKCLPGFFHVVKHLREQAEIVAARPVVFVVKAADAADKIGERKYQKYPQYPWHRSMQL